MQNEAQLSQEWFVLRPSSRWWAQGDQVQVIDVHVPNQRTKAVAGLLHALSMTVLALLAQTWLLTLNGLHALQCGPRQCWRRIQPSRIICGILWRAVLVTRSFACLVCCATAVQSC